MEKDHVMYKHTFIPILIPWQGCPVQVSDVLQSRAHEVMDVLLNTSALHLLGKELKVH